MNRRYGLEPARAADQLQHLHPPRENEAGFVPFPPPPGAAPYRLALAELGVDDPADALEFHVIGDHGGIVDAQPQKAVAAALAADASVAGLVPRVARPGETLPPAVQPRFLYSVGDLVYYNGDASQWFQQFYEPYEEYPGPIVGVPGNHDGDNSDNPAVASLDAFYRNMCGAKPALTPEAGDINRDCMTQPGPYWTLTSQLATIVGLYSNVPSGGDIEPDQADWLVGELEAAPIDRALIVAVHHPPYSCDGHHGGSARIGQAIDDAALAARRDPDLVLSGHVHNYQRFTRTDGIAYIVCGAGGYHNLHQMASDVGALPFDAGQGVTLESYCDTAWGFLRLTVTAQQISGVYTAVQRTGAMTRVDTFSVPL